MPAALLGDSEIGMLQLWCQVELTQGRYNCCACTGLSPEYVVILPSGVTSQGAQDFTTGQPVYKLRPEAMEALYILWRATGDPRYQHWAWSMFEAFERHCKVGLFCDAVTVTQVLVKGDDMYCRQRLSCTEAALC